MTVKHHHHRKMMSPRGAASSSSPRRDDSQPQSNQDAEMASSNDEASLLRSFAIVEEEISRVERLCVCSQLAVIWLPFETEPIAAVPRHTCVKLKERMDECLEDINASCADVSSLRLRQDKRFAELTEHVAQKCKRLEELFAVEARLIHDKTAVLHQREKEMLFHIRRGTGTTGPYAPFRALPLDNLVSQSVEELRALSGLSTSEAEAFEQEARIMAQENDELAALIERERALYLSESRVKYQEQLLVMQFEAAAIREFVETQRKMSKVVDVFSTEALEQLHPRLYVPRTTSPKRRRRRQSRSPSGRRPRWNSTPFHDPMH